MQKIKLERYDLTTSHTLGLLKIKKKEFFILERPWLNNEPRISCIPEGIYPGEFLPKSYSGKYKRVYHITEVPGRSEILIHAGNWVADSLGCLLIGLHEKFLDGQQAVFESRKALAAFVALLDEKPIELEIVSK